MDIEKPNELRLKNALATHFDCYEECTLRHPHFDDEVIRADLVAVGDYEGAEIVFAFEVKLPTEKWELKNWLATIKQATDYVHAPVIDPRLSAAPKQLKVHCSFVFPPPDLSPWQTNDSQQNRHYRDYDASEIAGAFLLAQHFKVGSVRFHQDRLKRLSINLGTDTLWKEGEGFRPKAKTRTFLHRIGTKRTIKY